MLLWEAMCFVLVGQVATVPISSTDSPDTSIGKERYESGVHTINNANPYQGITVTEGHGKYPVIFEPFENVQASHSTYKATSFIDFAPYFEYFQQFERYLEAFKVSIGAFENDPVLQDFERKLSQQPVIRKGKHANITLFVTYSHCFTDCTLSRLSRQPTGSSENAAWHDTCRPV